MKPRDAFGVTRRNAALQPGKAVKQPRVRATWIRQRGKYYAYVSEVVPVSDVMRPYRSMVYVMGRVGY